MSERTFASTLPGAQAQPRSQLDDSFNIFEPHPVRQCISLTSMLDNNDHAYASRLVNRVQGVDSTNSTTSCSLDDGRRVRREVEVTGRVDSGIGLAAGYCARESGYSCLECMLKGYEGETY